MKFVEKMTFNERWTMKNGEKVIPVHRSLFSVSRLCKMIQASLPLDEIHFLTK